MKRHDYEPPVLTMIVAEAELGVLYSTELEVPPGEDFGEEEWA